MAEQEAFEEAGVFGVVGRVPAEACATPGQPQPTAGGSKSLILYPLHVTATLHHWPEKAQRKRMWMSVTDALRAIHNPGVSDCIARFAQAMSEFPSTADGRRG